jgi:hypothetical protein
MVNATVDNEPVSIVLDGGQSTTVPSNETWRVSIHMMNNDRSRMSIDGIGDFKAREDTKSGLGTYLDVTLTGNQTIAETADQQKGGIFITGFVVNN